MSINTYSLARDGDTYLSANFRISEFRCKDGSDTILIDSKLVEILQEVRTHFGKPVIINSAYRTSAYNKKVGGSSSSQHCKGTAADICISGVDPVRIGLYVASLPYYEDSGGIGVYSRASGIRSGFVHIDVRASSSRWLSKSGTTYLSVSKIMPTLSLGNLDAHSNLCFAVTILQRHLGVVSDGIFGDSTKAALMEWQSANGLTADGIAGPKTWAALTHIS